MLEEEEEEALVRWEPHLMGGFQRVFLAMVWNKLSSNSLNIGYFGVIWLFRITLSSLFFFFFFWQKMVFHHSIPFTRALRPDPF